MNRNRNLAAIILHHNLQVHPFLPTSSSTPATDSLGRAASISPPTPVDVGNPPFSVPPPNMVEKALNSGNQVKVSLTNIQNLDI